MSEPHSLLDDDPGQMIVEALQELRPELNQIRFQGIAAAGALGVVAVSTGMIGVQSSSSPLLYISAFAVAGAGIVYASIRRRQEKRLLPVLAQTLGFSHAKGQRGRYPDSLLPRASQSVDDSLQGNVAGRSFELDEVTITTGGKNKSTLFKGYVLGFRMAQDLPDFLIGSNRHTKPPLIGRPLLGGDGSYANMGQVAASSDGPIDLLLPASGRLSGKDRGSIERIARDLVSIVRTIGEGHSLYSAMPLGGWLFLAVSHRGDLFKVGGALAGSDRIASDVQRALGEFLIPMRLAAALIEAEAGWHDRV